MRMGISDQFRGVLEEKATWLDGHLPRYQDRIAALLLEMLSDCPDTCDLAEDTLKDIAEDEAYWLLSEGYFEDVLSSMEEELNHYGMAPSSGGLKQSALSKRREDNIRRHGKVLTS